MSNDPIVIPADPNDPEDFDVTASMLERGLRGREVRRARHALGLTQAQFAERFHVPLGTLRDWEEGRATAPDFAMAYVRVIRQHPDLVAAAVA